MLREMPPYSCVVLLGDDAAQDPLVVLHVDRGPAEHRLEGDVLAAPVDGADSVRQDEEGPRRRRQAIPVR